MDTELRDLIEMSHAVGCDPGLVQGGGGNTSVKTSDRRMYVKASGTALKDMRQGAGYRLVDIDRCLSILDDPALAAAAGTGIEEEVTNRLGEICLDDLSGRPSVETPLHALLGRCVVHTHPSIVGGLLCARKGAETLADLFGDLDPPHVYLGYVNFGYALAIAMRAAINDFRRKHDRLPRVVFLGNHGLITSADTAAEALQLTRRVLARVRDAWEAVPVRPRTVPAYTDEERANLNVAICDTLKPLYEKILGAPVLVRMSCAPSVDAFFAHPDCEELVTEKPLTPDPLVYCKGAPMWLPVVTGDTNLLQSIEALVRRHESGPATPVCLLVDGLGLFTVALSPKLLAYAEEIMTAVLEMLLIAASFGGVRSLSDDAMRYIRNSEVATYRQRLMAEGGR